MPLNDKPYIVFDLETGNKDRNVAPILQIAACVIDNRTLELKPGAEFQSYVKPTEEDKKYIQQEALDVNKITWDELNKAPLLTEVWPLFVSYVNRHNRQGTVWTAPIPCGHNIKGYDMPIIQRTAEKFGNTDKKSGQQNLFSQFNMIDTVDLLFTWFEGLPDGPENYKLDTLRDYFGLSKEGAHNAITDVKQTAQIIQRFLKYQRNLAVKAKFRGKFANGNN